jgi:hypothetical protein
MKTLGGWQTSENYLQWSLKMYGKFAMLKPDELFVSL